MNSFKILLIIALMGSSFLKVAGQAYHPFPTGHTVWTERVGKGDTTPAYMCYSLFATDTVINAVTYHQLYQGADTVYAHSTPIGGLREDTARRVYFYNYSTGTEKLLYNFKLAPGDTVRGTGFVGIVSYFDSINIGGAYRRQTHFKTVMGTAWQLGTWIEGIGNSSLGGLLNSVMDQPTCDCSVHTLCFKENGSWVYHNPAYATLDCDAAPLVVSDVASTMLKIRLYPNPVTGSQLYISGLETTATLKIFSTDGRLLANETVAKGDATVRIEQLMPGLYSYQVMDRAGRVSNGTFVVQ